MLPAHLQQGGLGNHPVLTGSKGMHQAAATEERVGGRQVTLP